MATSILNKIEYLVLLVAAFAAQSKLSDPKTGLYFQSSGYVYSFLESELEKDVGL